MIHNASYSTIIRLMRYPSFLCSMLIKRQQITHPQFCRPTFFNLSIAITPFYFLHREIKTGDTFLVICSNKHAIHDGFKGLKNRFLRSLLDPSLQDDSTINSLAASTHI